MIEQYVELIEEKRERYPDATPTMLLGMLHDDLPDDHAEAWCAAPSPASIGNG